MRKYINSVSDLEKLRNQGTHISFSKLEYADEHENDKVVDHGSLYLSDWGKQSGEMLSQLQAEWWMGKLTRKQQKVILAMQSERKRRKVAEDLGVSLQAVNQIIIRIRRRIEIYQAMSD